MDPSPLPESLPPTFTTDHARAEGVTPRRLRASDLVTPFHGTRSRLPLDGLVDRMRLLCEVLPEHAFIAGPTAALAWGFPLTLPLTERASGVLCVGVPAKQNRIRRPGVRGRALQLDPEDIVERDGYRVTRPERTWVDISEEVSLPRLVAITDFLLRNGIQRYELDRAQERAGRRKPGRERRERALWFSDPRSESPKESELRVLLHEARIPRPELNVEIFNGSRFVGRVDMLIRHAKVVIEYQGDYHRDPKQWRRDEQRRGELESLGYVVTYVTQEDLEDPERLAERIHRLIAMQLAR